MYEERRLRWLEEFKWDLRGWLKKVINGITRAFEGKFEWVKMLINMVDLDSFEDIFEMGLKGS